MPKGTIEIIHLEDDPRDCELVEALLLNDGISCEFDCVQTGEAFRSRLLDHRPDLIISDYTMPTYDGMRALRLARELHPTVPFIFFSGTLGEEVAVAGLRDGATDYILKERPGRLVAAIRRALAEAEERIRRQQAEEKIREQAALLNEARDAICLQDLEQRILFWNRGAERLYGWTSAEAVSRRASELLVEDTAGAAALAQAVAEGEWHGELHQVTRDARPLIVESRWTLIRDDTGEPRSILVINSDVTDKKAIEAQYLRAQRMESIGMLAGGISHDLNNILGPILMSAELLMTDPAGDPRPLLEGIASSARRGTDLVRQILAFARGANGERMLLDLRHVVNEVAAMLASTFPRNIDVSVQVPRELPQLLGNATQLHQVLLNLCLNARDAMPQGGSLTIAANPVTLTHRQTSLRPEPLSGEFIELRVGDTGCGIAAEILPKVFDPFFTTKEMGKGTGLGLTTVVGIIRGHHGSLDVASEPGRGTVFTIYLPAASAENSAAPPAPPETPGTGRGECILCADDEPPMLEISRRALVKAGYRVLLARDGVEALGRFVQHRDEIDLVITDMMMPLMEGPQFVGALRKLAPNLRIIAVSGLFSNVQVAEDPASGVQAMLHKPYDATTLLSVVRRVLDAKVGS